MPIVHAKGVWSCAQAGLKKLQLNVLSSCEETDAIEDLSPLRSRSRKKKVLSLSSLVPKTDTACETLHVYIFGTSGRPYLALLRCLQRAFKITSAGSSHLLPHTMLVM